MEQTNKRTYVVEIKKWALQQKEILEVADFNSKGVYHYWIDELTVTSNVEDLENLREYIDDLVIYYIREEVLNDINRLIKKYGC